MSIGGHDKHGRGGLVPSHGRHLCGHHEGQGRGSYRCVGFRVSKIGLLEVSSLEAP